MSLVNEANKLFGLGRHEEGLKTNYEGVTIYRQLAKKHPSAFISDLAIALHNRVATLIECGELKIALEFSKEAVATLRPFFLERPKDCAQRMAEILGGYFKLCSLTATRVDKDLIGPILVELQKFI